MLLNHRSNTAAADRDTLRTDPRIAAGLFEILRPCHIDGCGSSENHLLPKHFKQHDNCFQLYWMSEAGRCDVSWHSTPTLPFSKQDTCVTIAYNGMVTSAIISGKD